MSDSISSGDCPGKRPTAAQITAPRGRMFSWIVTRSTMSRGSRRSAAADALFVARRALQAGVPAPLSADQFGFGNPGALLALQLERLHGVLVLEGDGEFAFDALAVDGAGVVGAEG